jgi:hypothetical protein
MKPALFLTMPPLAFIASAMLAGLMPAHDPAMHQEKSNHSSPRKRAAATKDSQSSATDIPALLGDLERRMVHFPPPEVEVHDGRGMEVLHIGDENGPSFCGSGMASIEYSMDWARENPAGMFEWFNQHWTVSGYKRLSLAHTLFSEWATQDMAAALAAVPRMTHAGSRAQALVSTLEILCHKDPAKARGILLQNLDTLEALNSVQFGLEDGSARTELILALPPDRLRSLFLAKNISNLASDYADGNAELAVELWKRCSADERRDLVAAGLRLSGFEEIRLDGLEDLSRQHAETSNDPLQASSFLNHYGKSWAERDPESAVSWGLAHLKGMGRTVQTFELITHAAAKDFAARLRAWRSLPEGALREEAARRLLHAAPAGHEEEKSMLLDLLPKPGKW